MAKNKSIKIVAFLALFGIIIGIVGTSILVIFNGGQKTTKDESLTADQYKQIQDMIKAQGGTGTSVSSGVTESGSTDTGVAVTGSAEGNGVNVSTGSVK